MFISVHDYYCDSDMEGFVLRALVVLVIIC